MKFVERIKSYHKSEIRREEVLTKKWFLFQWEILVVVGLALFAAILNQIPVWVGGAPGTGNDVMYSYALRTDIIYSSFSMFLTIGIAIFIGVFTEIGKMAGKYGAAVFVLVPAFVWLLSEREEDPYLDNMLETCQMIEDIIFWAIVASAILFFVGSGIKIATASIIMSEYRRLQLELFFNYFLRFVVVMINVMIVLLVSISFINYAIFSLHLADVTNADRAANPELVGYAWNLKKQSFKVFHVVITIVFAVIMVCIGLATTFTENIRAEEEEEANWGFIKKEHEIEERAEKKLERDEDIVARLAEVSMTKEMDVPKKRWKWGKHG